jgi:hypothetical protein
MYLIDQIQSPTIIIVWKDKAMKFLSVQIFGFLESVSKTTYQTECHIKQFNIRLIPAFSYVPADTVTATDRMAMIRVLTMKATFFNNQIQHVNQCTMKCFLLHFSYL